MFFCVQGIYYVNVLILHDICNYFPIEVEDSAHFLSVGLCEKREYGFSDCSLGVWLLRGLCLKMMLKSGGDKQKWHFFLKICLICRIFALLFGIGLFCPLVFGT